MPQVKKISSLSINEANEINSVVTSDVFKVDGVGVGEELNVFLVGGQSNSDGRVPYTSGPSYLQNGIVDNIAAFNGNRIIYDLRDGQARVNGRSPSAVNDYAFNHVALYQIGQDLPNVTTVQITVGGSPLYSGLPDPQGIWNADYSSIPSSSPALLKALQQRFEQLESFVSSRPGLRIKVRGLIWHQGESDKLPPADSDYASNWAAVVAKVRSFTNTPNLPIFYGTIPSTSSAYSLNVRNAQLDFASNDANAYCRDNNDLTMFDGLHFDAASCNTFGDWVYTTFSSL